jgi:hypothetical protein
LVDNEILPAEETFDNALKNVRQCKGFIIAHFIAKIGKDAKHIDLLVPFEKGTNEI